MPRVPPPPVATGPAATGPPAASPPASPPQATLSFGRRLWLWGPVVLYASLIFGLSSTPRLPSPPIGISDKDAHFSFYFGLCVLVVRALTGGCWHRMTGRIALWAAVATTIYGATDEIHQLYVPGREGDLADLFADGLGAATAAGLLLAWTIIGRRWRAWRTRRTA